ncbi:hypothetical protein HanXRQr2_Chr13g0616491 [Helianthus annuus]|uniref:Secreted protein n=1 Tax=Helianthus annuus TaxID=4232 RepID=A0A251SZ79_HELAN|nr:hypothetical protein HanXRQr2_Chr13g0616491 [Helianthus annuus]
MHYITPTIIHLRPILSSSFLFSCLPVYSTPATVVFLPINTHECTKIDADFRHWPWRPSTADDGERDAVVRWRFLPT